MPSEKVYSIERGKSLDKHKFTIGDMRLPFVNIIKYLDEKEALVLSITFITVGGDESSIELLCDNAIVPLVVSLQKENFIPDLQSDEIVIVSAISLNYLLFHFLKVSKCLHYYKV